MVENWKIICCPVDFTEPARAAFRVAVDLCARLGAELVLLHVDSAEKIAEEMRGHDSPERLLAVWGEDARRLGATHVRLARASGQPEIAVLDHARRDAVDMIVIGTHGRTDREKMLTGSVAEGVVRNAECPVLTVRPPKPR